MGNFLVKQVVDDDGEVVPKSKRRWHFVVTITGDRAMLCTGNFIDPDASSGNGEAYKCKEVKRGGISCEQCLDIIKEFKKIRL